MKIPTFSTKATAPELGAALRGAGCAVARGVFDDAVRQQLASEEWMTDTTEHFADRGGNP